MPSLTLINVGVFSFSVNLLIKPSSKSWIVLKQNLVVVVSFLACRGQ